MRIIGLGRLQQFTTTHPDCRSWVKNWVSDVKASQWKTTQDIKRRYPAASFLPDNVVIFNVRGNNYRLVTQIAFGVGVVAVKWEGTHAEYSRQYR